MPADAYTVRLDTFEGPLDLLLHLVKSNEVDIYHLPIKAITDQYIEYVGMMEELNLDVAGEYLVMAATLMYLKSRLLLPIDEDDEGDDEEDPAADLVRQLAEYQRYREAADELRDRVVLGRDVFRREASPPPADEREPVPLKTLEFGVLLDAFRRVLARAADRIPHELIEEEYSVRDAVQSMVDRLRTRRRMNFEDLFVESRSRGMIIATFIGLLELLKLGVLDVEQVGTNAPIEVSMAKEDIDDNVLGLIETYSGGAADEDEEEEAFVVSAEEGETSERGDDL